MTLRYLEGEEVTHITAKTMRALVGRRIQYLRKVDIDRTGRGYFFPRFGQVTEVHGREFSDGGGRWVSMGDVVEMVVLPEV
jgi:hypothetical protein